jgi:hypothetical protein
MNKMLKMMSDFDSDDDWLIITFLDWPEFIIEENMAEKLSMEDEASQ